MNDNYISQQAVIASALWAVSVGLVAATWTLAANGTALCWMGAVATTAVLTMTLATVCQVRLYVLRVCGLIRVSAGLETPDAEVRPLTRV